MVVHRSATRRFVKIQALIAAITVALLVAGNPMTRAAGPTVVGSAPPGQNSMELIGKIDQTALTFNGYGYFTYISGIPADQMFSDPNPLNHNEGTAHFTFVSTANLTARSVLEKIFVLNAIGTTTVYYNDKPGAKFGEPKSFSAGIAIASGPERWQSIINVQAPDTAISTGIGEFTEKANRPFRIGANDYVLGNPNQVLRFFYTGEGKRTEKDAPNSTHVIAGYGTIGGQ